MFSTNTKTHEICQTKHEFVSRDGAQLSTSHKECKEGTTRRVRVTEHRKSFGNYMRYIVVDAAGNGCAPTSSTNSKRTVIGNYATNQSSQIWPKENQNKVSFLLQYREFGPKLSCCCCCCRCCRFGCCCNEVIIKYCVQCTHQALTKLTKLTKLTGLTGPLARTAIGHKFSFVRFVSASTCHDSWATSNLIQLRSVRVSFHVCVCVCGTSQLLRLRLPLAAASS